jgi:hypothetical protein
LDGVLTIGLHVAGEWNHHGVVDYSCENVGVALDSPYLHEFMKNVVLPLMDDECRHAWKDLFKD